MTDIKNEGSEEKNAMMCDFNFSEGDFEEMVEMMKKCCPDAKGNFDCCSMMEGMMKNMTG